jgi:HAE1 family hydrophobic/amphiphilic exporter-1
MKDNRYAFTTQRPVAITMIVLAIALFGFISYTQMSWDLMPEISYPTYTIRTEYPGAAPEEVENVVSRPLEAQLSLIKNLNSITSVSRPEQSDIILEFIWGTDLDRAAQEIREKLDQVYLEQDVKRPMILRYDPSLDPILRIAISDPTIPLMDLRQMVEDEVARDLEGVPGVAAAKVKGGLEKEILVKLDEKLLSQTRIPYNQVTTRLLQENVNLAGGNIKEGETEYIVRTLNELRSVEDIGEIIITQNESVKVRLRDIAKIEYSHKERTVITRINGVENVELDIFKEADANIVAVAKAVLEKLQGRAEQRAFVAEMARVKPVKPQTQAAPSGQPGRGGRGGPRGGADFAARQLEQQMTDFIAYRLPKSLDIEVLSDQSIFIENSINEVKSTAIMGGFLAILILYLFLRHLGTTMIVAVSIPISIVATFAPLKLFGVSMNIMSLGGLALGVGMLVDSSIVVMESIFRCREEGDGFIESVVRGVGEVGGAVVSSTLTTVAVFFPIVFVEGIAGQIFGDLSLSVVFSLLASLLVSLFFIPMLASRKFDFKASAIPQPFVYSFEKRHTPGTFLSLFYQMPWMVGRIALAFMLVLIGTLLALITVLLWVLIRPFGLHRPILGLFEKLGALIQRIAPLWDDFGRSAALSTLSQSFEKRRFFLLHIPVYLFALVRFLLQSFMALIVRFVMSLLVTLILIGKFFLSLFAAILVPLIAWITRWFTRFIDVVNTGYPRLLDFCIKHDWRVMGITVLLFAVSIFVIYPSLGSELIPQVHQGTLYLNVNFPVGIPVEKNDERMKLISDQIGKLPLVRSVGYSSGTTKDELSENEVGEHIAKLTINVEKGRDIYGNEERVMADIRSVMASKTDMDYTISRPALFTLKSPIELVVKGYNLESLRETSQQIHQRLLGISGLKDVQSTIRPGFPELVVQFDRTRLSHYGLNAFTVATLIKNKIEGNVPTKFKEQDRRIDIRVYLRDDQRQKADDIRNLIINPGAQIPIRLSSVAEVLILSGPNEIRRVGQERSAIITANVDGVDLNMAVERIYDMLDQMPMPKGIRYELSGQNKEMETSMNSMIMAMLLAVFLVYIVMASQFESFMHPFLIIFTIPMALIGVILTLWVIGMPLGVTVYIGIITLVGVVVNNAIVLIDYINTLRKRGEEKIAAIRKAGAVRLRPILITTMTTVLGLLPMAMGLGEGAEIRTPMAITVIAGLASSTFLTLILIPVIYKRFSR